MTTTSQSVCAGTETDAPLLPVHWEDAVIPAEWRRNKTYQRGHGYAPHIGALDIETSQNDQCAWMYLWTFAVDDLIVYGRTPDDLKHWLRRLSNALDLRTDYRLLVYIHNAKYDLTFLKHHICMIPTKKSDFIAKSRHQILRCVVEGVYEIRDSVVFSEMPLRMMGIEIGLHKLEEDHDLIRTPETELEDADLIYCGRDSQILTRYYRIQADLLPTYDENGNRKKHYGNIGNVPLTATGRDRNMISHAFSFCSDKYKRWILDRQLRINPPQMPQQQTQKNMQKYDAMLQRYQHDLYTMNRLRMAFFGGFCYASTLWGDTELSKDTGAGDGVVSADLDACYAAEMLTKRFPMDRWQPVPDWELPRTREQQEDVLHMRGWYKNRALLLHMRLSNIESRVKDFGFLPSWYKYHVKESGLETFKRSERVYKCNEMEVVMTDIDFRQLLKWYKCDVEMIDGLSNVYDYLPDYITDTVIMLYKDKADFKDYLRPKKAAGTDTDEENIEYQYKKTMLARVYGVFCQDPIRMLYEWDEQTHSITSRGYEQPETTLFSSVLYQWGVWTAAHARDTLLKMCARVGADHNGQWDYRLIYCDTDCIRWIDDGSGEKMRFIDGYNQLKRKQIASVMTLRRIFRINNLYDIEIDPHRLDSCGQWEIERFRSYKHIGIKMYAVVKESGKFKATIAGLPANQTYFDQFETNEEKMAAFTSTLYIDEDHTKLLMTQYIEQKVECDVVDYKGKPAHIVSMSSVRLVKTDFRARPDKHADILKDLNFEEFFLDCGRMGINLVPSRYGF